MQKSIAECWSSLFSEQIIFICCSFYATPFMVVRLIQIVEFLNGLEHYISLFVINKFVINKILLLNCTFISKLFTW